MKAQTRNLAAAGVEGAAVAARVLDALAAGMVLHERKVRATTGTRRVLSRTWVLMDAVIVDGVVVRLVETDATRAANAVGRHAYGLRPADIDMGMLREVCPDVHWLGPVGAQRIVERGGAKPVDLWSGLLPSATNHAPAVGDAPGEELRFGSDAELALAGVRKGEREALAAMIEGLHLVDAAVQSNAEGRRAEKRSWRPLRPVHDADGAITGYEVDARVLRYTNNAGRIGFSNLTYQNLSPLLAETGYDPRDAAFGHSYRIADVWIERVRARLADLGWVPEAAAMDEGGAIAETLAPTIAETREEGERDAGSAGAADAAGTRGTEPNAQAASHPTLTPRQFAILAWLRGEPFDIPGDEPTHIEIGQTIANHGGDDTAILIAAAIRKAVRTGRDSARRT